MGFRAWNGSWLSVVRVFAGERGADFCRLAFLSWGLEPTHGGQLEYGYARGVGLDHGLRLQHLGFIERRWWPCLFHGSSGDHHADQHRTLDGITSECAGLECVAAIAGLSASAGPTP